MSTTTNHAASTQGTISSGTAYQILRSGFTAAPILFGLDKFFDLMTDSSSLPSRRTCS